MLFQPIGAGIDETIDRVRFWRDNPGIIAGLSSGYGVFDTATGGFEPTDLWILAGRPGMGKTSLALNIATKVATSCIEAGEGSAFIVSTEMPADLLRRRLAAMYSKVSEFELRAGRGTAEEYAKFERTLRRLANLPIHISDRPGSATETGDPLDPYSICGAIRRAVADGLYPKLLVVDHIGRLGDKGDNANYRIGSIARNLKNLAMELRIPVLALSQLNRAVEQREDKRPQLSDLRDSGEVEQEADGVLLMLRPDYYAKDGEGVDPKFRGKCIVDVAKARSGPTGEFHMNFDARTTLFSDS